MMPPRKGSSRPTRDSTPDDGGIEKHEVELLRGHDAVESPSTETKLRRGKELKLARAEGAKYLDPNHFAVAEDGEPWFQARLKRAEAINAAEAKSQVAREADAAKNKGSREPLEARVESTTVLINAPSGDVVPPIGQPYTHAYRLHQGGRGYVALCRKPGTNGRVMDQRCYDIAKLFDHLPPTGATDDHYISVNTFRRPHRRVASLLGLRATFLDLDYHRLPVWAHATAEQVWAEVEEFLLQRALPMPTMVVASGRGLHVYWNYHRGLPKKALPRWTAVQQHLCRALKVFGADPNSIDAARVLRIAGTTNTKAGTLAYFLHLDDDRDIDFEDLARAVLPLTQHQLQQLRRTRAIEAGEAREARSLRSRTSNRAFVDVILADIDRLIALRWNGRIPEGHRNTTLFVRGCFLVRRTGVDALEAALLEYGISTCDLELEEMAQVAGSIAKKIVEDGRGYRYSVVGAAEDLGITVEEVHAAGLVRLHPADPELEEARREAHRAHDRERKALERRAKGIPPRGESLATSRPWDRLGTSERTWYRRGKPDPDK